MRQITATRRCDKSPRLHFCCDKTLVLGTQANLELEGNVNILVSKCNMADQRIQRRCNKKKLLVLFIMLLGDDKYKQVERRGWSRQWVSRREEGVLHYI